MTSTIFAQSSGAPPAGIAVIRVSGPDALRAVAALAGSLPPPRTARVRVLRDGRGNPLDRALVLTFPGPGSVTGEDLAELHCHGGRAVVAAVLAALAQRPGLRPAEAGEFTRRALTHGRIDLAEARGLADLLAADTERQRIAAIASAEGIVSRQVRGWMDRLAALAARIEAQLDFADEGEVAVDASQALAAVGHHAALLAAEWGEALDQPPVERLRDGIHIVLAGPPNSGKSTLINLLTQRDVAIVSAIPGTTRDRIEAQVVREGLAYVITDTAGLTDSEDPIERIGVERADDAVRCADLLLWLGDTSPPRADAIWVHARSDLPGRSALPDGRAIAVARDDAASIARLWQVIATRAETLVPRVDAIAFRAREREAVAAACAVIEPIDPDPLVAAEQLRLALRALASILGIDATETMLDALFGQFCIGK